MSLLNIVRVIVYRFHEKGLEVFLLDDDLKNNTEIWKLPKSKIQELQLPSEFIEINDPDGINVSTHRTIAIEADWHEMPSIRGLLKNDARIVKELVKETLPGAEKGAYVAIKEVMKKSLPSQYKMLKELKDILVDRNLLRYL